MEKKENKWLLWVLLILFPPIGIIYMWIAKKEFPQRKKIILSVIFGIWFLLVLIFGNTEDTTETAGNLVTNESVSEESSKTTESKIEKADSTNSIPSNSSENVENNADESEITSSAETKAENDNTAATSKLDITNPLSIAAVRTSPVMNGLGTEKIGERAYIKITKEDLKTVTEQQYAKFVSETVENSGYNWFSIICNDDTGICFAGSIGYYAEYGKLDEEGSIAETIGYITISEDGYVYEEAE